MAKELSLTRPDNAIQWGFRLTGGADVDVPLTVTKITEDSIAEKAGIQVGDLLVRVGDTPTAGLTHLQVHDLIKLSGNVLVAAIIRGEIPEKIMETEQTIDSETSHDGISQSVQINIKANVVDTTQIIVESDEFVQQNIKINGTVISDQEEQNVECTVNKEEKLSEEILAEKLAERTRSEVTESQATQIKDELSINLEKLMQPPEHIKQSEVMKVINEESNKNIEDRTKKEKRWTTFLQKPDRPKPKIEQKPEDEFKKSTSKDNFYEEHVLLTRLLCIAQEPPYRVIIQKQKKKRDEEKTKSAEISQQETTYVPVEMMTETHDQINEETEQFEEEEQIEVETEIERGQEEMYEETEEAVMSEVELSLEDQLAAIQKQLLALSQLPAAIQQTLDVVTQQLTKIVGPVNETNTQENEIVDQEATFDDSERELEKTELETLEEFSEGSFDRNSQQEEEEEYYQEEKDRNIEEELEEHLEKTIVQPESEVTMKENTPEPEDLSPEELEAWRAEKTKKDKQKKENPIVSDLRQRRVKTDDYPRTPLQRPICLPGGKKWRAPDDAQPEMSSSHLNMSDEMIAETISAQTEVLVAHWNDVWPWGNRLGRTIYRDSNTHLVRSKAIESNKINFLKYQPPPKTLDHLKHSEVYRMVHDMDQPVRGVGARMGKAVAEEDVYAQVRSSGQEGQTKG